jgi:hypothetical protein
MSQEPDPADLLGRSGASELLSEDGRLLPEALGAPPALPPPSPRHRKLVVTGATLTGVTLFGGIALTIIGAIDAFSSGLGGVALVALILGIVMISTHWGWVHVAAFTADGIDSHRVRAAEADRQQWLAAIEPYTRYEVSTDVDHDGSLEIATVRYRPVALGDRQFTFQRDVLTPERHSEEEPAAQIAERAEHLRREAALETEAERTRYEQAADAHQRAQIGQETEEERLAARRAASEALSDQINTNLRDPPLTE